MANFEFNGDEYSKASKHQKEWGQNLIDELPVNPSDNILDLGCGDGFLTKKISEKVPDGKVIGIDASSGMIEKAKEFESGNCTFILMDINDMNFVSEFDIIISNAALHWVKDHHKLMKNCSRALKPGGIIRFNFAGKGNCLNFYETVTGIMASEKFRERFADFEWPWFMPSPLEYKKIMEETDFSHFKIWEENADRYFNTSNEMILWIKNPSIVPFSRHIHESASSEFFIDETIKTMIKKTSLPDGRCFEYFRRINIFAQK